MDRIRHYEIARRLGEGKHGPTFLAIDTGHQRAVVIKRLTDPETADAEWQHNYREHLRQLGLNDDKRLTRTYSLEEDNGALFVVREYVDGQNLSDFVANDLPTPARILEIARQLALQLKALHDRDLIHGNICPANVIIDANGHARLLDDGLGFSGDAWSNRSSVFPHEMACLSPELFTGGIIGPHSDHYALGALVYLMWTGQPAYPDDDPKTAIRSIVHEPVSFEVHPSREMTGMARLLTSKLLAKDPDDRFVSTDELLFTLREMIDFGTTPEPPARTRKWAPSSRQYFLISVLAMLLVILWLVITMDRP